MDANTLSSALANVGTVVTQATGIITGSEILMVMFAGGLLSVGFKAIKWAKRAVKG